MGVDLEAGTNSRAQVPDDWHATGSVHLFSCCRAQKHRIKEGAFSSWLAEGAGPPAHITLPRPSALSRGRKPRCLVGACSRGRCWPAARCLPALRNRGLTGCLLSPGENCSWDCTRGGSTSLAPCPWLLLACAWLLTSSLQLLLSHPPAPPTHTHSFIHVSGLALRASRSPVCNCVAALGPA